MAVFAPMSVVALDSKYKPACKAGLCIYTKSYAAKDSPDTECKWAIYNLGWELTMNFEAIS